MVRKSQEPCAAGLGEKNCQRDPSGVGNGVKRDSGKPPEQSGTARCGSWRRKQSVRPKCRQHWKEKSDNLEKRKEM